MIGQNIKNAVYPLLGVAVILLVWQFYTHAFAINRIVLPSPLDIIDASIVNWKVLLLRKLADFS